MRQFSIIAISLFFLLTVTMLLGEAEERTVAKNASLCNLQQGSAIGSSCCQGMGVKARNQEINRNSSDSDHHPVKNFFVKTKGLTLVKHGFTIAHTSRAEDAPKPKKNSAFIGRAPPYGFS